MSLFFFSVFFFSGYPLVLCGLLYLFLNRKLLFLTHMQNTLGCEDLKVSILPFRLNWVWDLTGTPNCMIPSACGLPERLSRGQAGVTRVNYWLLLGSQE